MDWIWGVMFVIVMVLEFVGLRRRDDRWPTLTDVVLRPGFGWVAVILSTLAGKVHHFRTVRKAHADTLFYSTTNRLRANSKSSFPNEGSLK